MAEEEKNIAAEQQQPDTEAAELRQMILELNDRLKSIEKENKELKAENRKYFYDSLKTGLEDEPAVPPEPQPTILSDEEINQSFKNIIKGAL